MEFKTANISFGPLEARAAKHEIKASFAFSQYQGALDISTETYQRFYPGYSWLGVKTELFDGWLATVFIEFCFPDDAYGYFEVYPGIRMTQEGDWLWFPVSKINGVETFS